MQSLGSETVRASPTTGRTDSPRRSPSRKSRLGSLEPTVAGPPRERSGCSEPSTERTQQRYTHMLGLARKTRPAGRLGIVFRVGNQSHTVVWRWGRYASTESHQSTVVLGHLRRALWLRLARIHRAPANRFVSRRAGTGRRRYRGLGLGGVGDLSRSRARRSGTLTMTSTVRSLDLSDAGRSVEETPHRPLIA